MMIVGYGSGLLRVFSLPTGYIMAEMSAHTGWITGMDLTSQSGMLITCSEDGFVRVRALLWLWMDILQDQSMTNFTQMSF